MEKFAILGSNSFSGAHCVSQLLEEGAEVLGISRSPEPHDSFLPYKQKRGALFRFHQLDLNHHLPQVTSVIQEFKPEYVINFAAQSMVGESWLHPEHWFQTNVMAAVLLHNALRTCAFLKKYVHISTPEVYGCCQGRQSEHTRYEPSTPYAVSRAAADMYLMTLYRTYSFPVVFTRAANVYGPGQQPYRIIPKTMVSIITGRRLPLHGGGRSVRSFIYIRDVISGTLKAARLAEPGEIFHFSTDSAVSIRDLVGRIAQKLGREYESCIEDAEDRPGKDLAYLLDSGKARSQLNWKDAVSLEQGLNETLAWVESNLDLLRSLPLSYIHKP